MNNQIDAAQGQQVEAMAARLAAGEQLAGWKAGLTSGDSRDAFGAGVRPFGYVLKSRVFGSGYTFWWDSSVALDTSGETLGESPTNVVGGIENELCFEFAETVSEDVDAGAVRECLTGMAPAFEVTQQRVTADASPRDRVTDNLSQWGIVVGEVVPIPANWQQGELKVGLLHNADGVASVIAQDHIDDHFETLAQLSNRLRRFGQSIEAGQQVITGAFGRQSDPKAGLWSGDFGDLGRVHLRVER